jgi:hypothetical protein
MSETIFFHFIILELDCQHKTNGIYIVNNKFDEVKILNSLFYNHPSMESHPPNQSFIHERETSQYGNMYIDNCKFTTIHFHQ